MITHLITDSGLSEPLDESCHHFGILPLVCEPSNDVLFQQFLGQFFDFFKCAATIVGGGPDCDKWVHVPGQPFTSICLLGVPIDRCRGDVLFEPIQLGYQILDLLLDVFRMLQESVSVEGDSRSLNRYLVVFDKCGYAAEGGLEGREPIGGLFRDI